MRKDTVRFLAQASFVLAAFAVTGWGCAKPLQRVATQYAGPAASTLQGLSAHDAAQKINLVPGSIIEMRQTFLGFGAKLAAALAGENKEGVRVIVVSRFAPMNVADVEWKLSTKTETGVDKVGAGKMSGFNLADGHGLYLPALWPESPTGTALGTTGIWLSDDQYQSLERNRVATLDFGLLDAAVNQAIAKISGFKEAFAALKKQVAGVENRTDVFKLDGEKDLAEWPLKVNGQDVKVEVIKARTWFGEIVVLNNRQNPLVLKVTLNPAAGGGEIFTKIAALRALAGYEITELKDVQE